MPRYHRAAPLAAFALLLCLPSAARAGASPLSQAWLDATGDRASALHLEAALDALADDLRDAEPTLARGVAESVLRKTLEGSAAEPALGRLVDALVDRVVPPAALAKSLLGPVAPLDIGPFELTRRDVQRLVGSRVGRDRAAIVEGLRALDPVAASSLADTELLALVPRLVRIASDLAVDPGVIEARFRSVLDPAEVVQ